jgi:hypothetical protein
VWLEGGVGDVDPIRTTGKKDWHSVYSALIKKEIKFSSYIRKFRVEKLQSHI